MQMKNLRTKMEVLNKVNGKLYEITSVTQAQDEALLTEILPEDAAEDAVADVVKMTESNALCFRFMEDPNARDIPDGYSIENGIIMKDKKPVTVQGQIVVKEILKAIPGKLLLLVETKDKDENRSDLMAYDPENDKFEKVLDGIGTATITEVDKDLYLITDIRISEVVKTDEDGEPIINEDGTEVKGEFLDASKVYLVNGSEVRRSVALSDPVESLEIINGLNGEMVVIAVSTKKTDCDGFLVPREGNVGIEPIGLDVEMEDEEDEVRSYDLWKRASYELEGSSLVSATIDVDGSALLKSDAAIIYTNTGHSKRVVSDASAVAAVAGYDTLVAAKVGEHEFKLTLANKNYELKTIVSTKTRDRGIVVSVE